MSNREILFRGKRKDNGEWVYGFYYQSKVSGCYILVPKFTTNMKNNQIKDNGFDFHRVIPETIGQYTGLTDKNGTKIFEGDILNFFDSDGQYTNYEVIWFGNGWEIVMCRTSDADDLDLFICENSVVIGNIHDNPDFLEGE